MSRLVTGLLLVAVCLVPVAAQSSGPTQTEGGSALVVRLWDWEPALLEVTEHVVSAPPARSILMGLSPWLPSDIDLTWNVRRDSGEDAGGSYSESFDELGILEDSGRRWDRGTDESTTHYLTLRLGWEPAEAREQAMDREQEQRDAIADAAVERGRIIVRVAEILEERRVLQARIVAEPPGPKVVEAVARVAILNQRLDLATAGWWTRTLRMRRPENVPLWVSGLTAD